MADTSEPMLSFLGVGWAFPPTFHGGGAELALVADVADIHESLKILLATRPGERPMQELYGCNLDDVMFEEVDAALVKRITTLVSTAVLHHEPRVVLQDVDVSQSAAHPGLLLIRLDYTVPATNTRYNMVYPFWIHEAVAAGR